MLSTLALWLLAGCGGPGVATATAIPADIVRPDQPTPAYSTAQPRYRIDESTPVPLFAVTLPAQAEDAPPPSESRMDLVTALLMDQPPSAMGIASGGVTVFSEPGGAALTSVPPGLALTVTGRSRDGAWLAVYTNDAIVGWIPAGSVLLYGADDLTVVDKAFSPAPVATLLAQAMTPASTPISQILDARRNPPVTTPAAAPALDTAPAAPGNATVGAIVTGGNTNLRAGPGADNRVLASLPPESQVIVLGRTEAGDWLQLRTPNGDGWVSAARVTLPGAVDALPVTIP